MRNRGQTSIEYLLLTAGVVLTAIVAGQYAITSAGSVSQQIQTETNVITPSDTIPPTTDIVCNTAACLEKYNTDVNISFACQDNVGGTGCKETMYNVSCSGSCPTGGTGTWKTCSQLTGCKNVFILQKPASGSAAYTIEFYSEDMNGNVEAKKRVTIIVGEPTGPICTITTSPQYPKKGSTTVITAKVLDGIIKNATMEVNYAAPPAQVASHNCGDLLKGSACSVTVTPDRSITIEVRGTDITGSPVKCGPTYVVVDGTPPQISYSLQPSTKWVNSDVNINYTITDPPEASGPWYVEYTVYNTADTGHGTSPEGSSGTIVIPIGANKFCYVEGAGSCRVELKPHDRADNVGGPVVIELNVDLSAPTSSASCNPSTCRSTSSVTVSLSCNDTYSGCAKTYYCKDTSNSCTPNTEYIGPITVSGSPGTYYVRFYSVDNAGNTESVKSAQVVIESSSPPPSPPPGGGGGGGGGSSGCTSDYQCIKDDPGPGCGECSNGTCYILDCSFCIGHPCKGCADECTSHSDCTKLCGGASNSNCGGVKCNDIQICGVRCGVCGDCIGPYCGLWSIGAVC